MRDKGQLSDLGKILHCIDRERGASGVTGGRTGDLNDDTSAAFSWHLFARLIGYRVPVAVGGYYAQRGLKSKTVAIFIRPVTTR